MPSNYVLILGDRGQNIPQTSDGAEVPLPAFNASGRQPGGREDAFIMYTIRGLDGSAQVFLNNNIASGGTITASPGAAFSTQMIAMPADQLNDGDNTIAIRNVTDPFTIKDVVCFFHTSS